jgi:hypothetical protein
MGVKLGPSITERTRIERVLENRKLKMFQIKRDEVTGGLRKLRGEEFHNLHPS